MSFELYFIVMVSLFWSKFLSWWASFTFFLLFFKQVPCNIYVSFVLCHKRVLQMLEIKSSAQLREEWTMQELFPLFADAESCLWLMQRELINNVAMLLHSSFVYSIVLPVACGTLLVLQSGVAIFCLHISNTSMVYYKFMCQFFLKHDHSNATTGNHFTSTYTLY